MLIRWVNGLRCRVGHWLMSTSWSKRIAVARQVAPSTTSLIQHRHRTARPLPLPLRSHLIYHQSAVDRTAAENCIATLARQVPDDDEVLLLDIGATADATLLTPLRDREWASYCACRATKAEQKSYTFGLNVGMAALKAPVLFVWRTDYVYPADIMARYRSSLTRAWFAAPYDVLVGHQKVDSSFVRENRERLDPFDESFWSACSARLSLYETQDPALFAIRRELWETIGGLNHELWGYGWQFAEFAARVRVHCPKNRIDYFRGTPPLHQTHGGSQMHQPVAGQTEAEAGRKRFADFLGGEAAYEMYRLKQKLPPLK